MPRIGHPSIDVDTCKSAILNWQLFLTRESFDPRKDIYLNKDVKVLDFRETYKTWLPARAYDNSKRNCKNLITNNSIIIIVYARTAGPTGFGKLRKSQMS